MLQYDASYYSDNIYTGITQDNEINLIEQIQITSGHLYQLAICGSYIEGFSSDDIFYSSEWTLENNTILYADFANGLIAPNIWSYYSGINIEALTVYRKRNDEYKFYKIAEIECSNCSGDVKEVYYRDNNVNSGYSYEYYAQVMVTNYRTTGTEYINVYFTWKGCPKVKFDGYYISDSNDEYHGILNLNINSSRNIKPNIVEPLYEKYPYVITNGKLNYNSFTIDTSFIEKNSWLTCNLDIEHQSEYRESVIDFLSNNQSKLLRLHNGRSYIVQTTSTGIQNTNSGYIDNVSTSFELAVTGDADDKQALYDNGFSQINPRMDGEA